MLSPACASSGSGTMLSRVIQLVFLIKPRCKRHLQSLLHRHSISHDYPFAKTQDIR